MGPPSPPRCQEMEREAKPSPLYPCTPENPLEVEEVMQCYVYDSQGLGVTFSSLFPQHGTTIVILVRHFLCYACQEYVQDLSRIPENLLQEANVRLVVIGQSMPRHIKRFRELTGYRHELFVDPDRDIYKALELKMGEDVDKIYKSPHVHCGLWWGVARGLWRAMWSESFDFQGDPKQQGGALVLGPGGRVLFSHRDEAVLDHTPINRLLVVAGIPPVDFTHGHMVKHV
ncbi:peroxiredoxin-like 2C [Lampetra fluviatilis]